jgi:ABC-type branched-subunit amino acid transport system permease subunit
VKVTPGSFTFSQSLSFITFAVIAGIAFIQGALLVPVFFVLLPALTASPVDAVNQAQFILAGYFAVRTVMDNPNGVAAFLVRLVRPFDRSERVAWASDEQDTALVTDETAPSALEGALA